MLIFVREIELQASFVEQGWELVVRNVDAREPERAWFGVQAVLVACANVAKILWGGNDAAARRREPLRRFLDVDESSALKSPQVRNDFEHFDERIERWVRKTDFPVYLPRMIEYRNWIEELVVDEEGEAWASPPTSLRYFGRLDPLTFDVEFWNHAVNLHDLTRDLERLAAVCGSLNQLPQHQRAAIWRAHQEP